MARNGFVLSAGTARGGTFSTLGIAALLVLLSALPPLFHLLWGRPAARRAGSHVGLRPARPHRRNEYTATGFSKPIRMIFSALYRPRREIQAEYEVSPYYPTAIRFESEIEPAFEKHVYDPFNDWLLRVARRMRSLQAGSIHAYLTYIFHRR